MMPFFFIFNKTNYARLGTFYLNELILLDETHPELSKEFENGNLSIARTKKSFSRQAIDLTLEQTINRDAASSATGIAAFTNNITARQRWSDGHCANMTVLTSLMEDLHFLKKDDITENLKKHRIKKNDLTLIKFEK